MSGSGSATDKSLSLGRAHPLPGPYLLEKKKGKGSIQMGSKIALKKKKKIALFPTLLSQTLRCLYHLFIFPYLSFAPELTPT